MLMDFKRYFFILLLCLFATSTIAAPSPVSKAILIAPECLLKTLTANYEILSKEKNFVLISTNAAGVGQLISAKNDHSTRCGSFRDVSVEWQNAQPAHTSNTLFLKQQLTPAVISKPAEYQIKYPKAVKAFYKLLNPPLMWENLKTFSDFHDRYAHSDNGVKAAYFIKDQVEALAKAHQRSDVTVSLIQTGSWKQPSVVAKIGTSNAAGIVIGAHMDTLHSYFSKMPGADDDGTGTVTVLELARAILSNDIYFQKPVYLIWYAAEEQGLIGSGYVVREFKEKNIPIEAVLHLDMTGYAYKNDPTIWLIKDYVNETLTAFIGDIISTYVQKPIDYTSCGYACSDHATWYQAGFASAIAFESSFSHDNPDIHSSQDKMENLSLQHMEDYLKIAAAFAIEIGEPKV